MAPASACDDDVLEAEPREDALVGVALRLVARVEPRVGVVERVGVLHRELATAQEAGAGPRLVAVLVLDLVDRQRQVLVRGVEVLHEQREDLLVRRREQVVGALAVLQPEDAVAVLGPAVRDLVGLARQQRREVHLVRARIRSSPRG